MQITVITKRGSFSTEVENLPPELDPGLRALVESAASEKLDFFALESKDGYIVLGRELLRSAVFVVQASESAGGTK